MFGLRKPQPCWTARSLDTLAFLAVAYPFASIVASWLFTGRHGDHIDHMDSIFSDWIRAILGMVATVQLGSAIWIARSWERHDQRWIFSLFTAVLFLSTVALITAVDVLRAGVPDTFGIDTFILIKVVTLFVTLSNAFAFAVAFAVALPGPGKGAGAVAFAITVAFAVDVASFFINPIFTYLQAVAPFAAYNLVYAIAVEAAVAPMIAVTIAIAVVVVVAARKVSLGVFWAIFWPASVTVLAITLLATPFWVHTFSSYVSPSLCILLGLLPLVNLPFDWASLGMTRALLRRGCEDYSNWPRDRLRCWACWI